MLNNSVKGNHVKLKSEIQGPYAKKDRLTLTNRFLIFSIILFLIILVAGSTAFILSMRQIIKKNNSSELSRMLEIQRIELENAVKAEVAIALKLADSPLIKRYLVDPYDQEIRKIAFEEINSYMKAFKSKIIFWVNDIDRIFNYEGNTFYWIDTEKPKNYWYNMTLYETEVYNFNINYNPDLNERNLWINAPVFDDNHKPIGMVGTGIELSEIIKLIYDNINDREEFYFFNANGEITGARDIRLVEDKKKIEDEITYLDVDISPIMESLKPGEIKTIDTSLGVIALGSIPELEWYSIALMADGIDDYNTTMTTLFFIMLALILLIFIVFNVFVANILNSLSKTMEKLEDIDRIKSQFMANMSHEIRTPMNAVLGMSDLLLHENLNTRQRGYVKDMKTSSMALLGIINDILDFSKMQSDKFELIPIHYDFDMLIDSVVSIVQFLVNDKKIAFRLVMQEHTHLCLYGDDMRLRQVLLNLLGNAVKFTNEGYVQLAVSFTDSTIKITVSDSGIGIPDGSINTIFDAFEQADVLQNRNTKGTGLGLSIVKSIVDMMGGQITVESVYGQGTSFYVEIPKILGEESLVRNINDTETVISAPGAKVLIVDDNKTNLSVAAGLMRIYQIAAVTANSGMQAIELVQQNNFDIIFMDYRMPEMNGIETTIAIRELDISVPIVALTASVLTDSLAQMLTAGMNDYLTKPIIKEDLVRVLSRWLPGEKILAPTISTI